MQILVKVYREQFIFTEGIVLALAKNQAIGLEILKEITPNPEQKLIIQGKKAMELWTTFQQGKDIIKLLYKTLQIQLRFESDEFDQIKTDRSKSEVLLAVLASRPDVDTSPDDYNTVFEIAVGAEHIIITSIASEPSEIDNSSGVRSPHHERYSIKM